MNRRELELKITNMWERVYTAFAADSEYLDGLHAKDVYKQWHRWRYGVVGFLCDYLPWSADDWDCDNRVREFVVRLQKKLRKKGKAVPAWFAIDKDHAYCAYVNWGGVIDVMDLRSGKLVEPEIWRTEMV